MNKKILSNQQIVTGYIHPDYVESLREFGRPRELPRCGGWILERDIPGLPYLDAMGCYPYFCCHNWSQLSIDMDDIGSDLVSLVVVTDPFGEHDPIYLRRCFKDVVIPFKEHFIADLRRPLSEIVSRHHHRYASQALRKVLVDICEEPLQFINEWITLYRNLIERHNISGIQAFSKTSFSRQLTIPGTVVLRASYDGITVGAQIYFVQGNVVHYHLGAASQLGYDLRALYAINFYSLEYFSAKVRWLNLGGGAGITRSAMDGLSLYKRGWSSETRTTYLCGRIFDKKRYAEIVKAKGIAATDYFPAYRKGEFS